MAKAKREQIGAIVCAHCAATIRPEGDVSSLPLTSGVHWEDGRMQYTCSLACRQALGWRSHRDGERCAEPCWPSGTSEVEA